MSRADAKHNVHLLHDYPVKAHAWSVTAEDKSVLLWEGGGCCKLSQLCALEVKASGGLNYLIEAVVAGRHGVSPQVGSVSRRR